MPSEVRYRPPQALPLRPESNDPFTINGESKGSLYFGTGC